MYLDPTRRIHWVFLVALFYTTKTDVQQWRYVSTKENPADDASREMNAARENSSSRWFQGRS